MTKYFVEGSPETKKDLVQWMREGRRPAVYNDKGLFTERGFNLFEIEIEGPDPSTPCHMRWSANVIVNKMGYITKVLKGIRPWMR